MLISHAVTFPEAPLDDEFAGYLGWSEALGYATGKRVSCLGVLVSGLNSYLLISLRSSGLV